MLGSVSFTLIVKANGMHKSKLVCQSFGRLRTEKNFKGRYFNERA